jgi:hypothetical protein
MSRKFLDYNPDTGLLTTTAFEDGRNIVKYEQDLEPFWEENARFRRDGDNWARGMKDEAKMVHAAYIPDLVILDMKTRFGVNFYDSADSKRVLQLLETEYTKCKLTDKKFA